MIFVVQTLLEMVVLVRIQEIVRYVLIMPHFMEVFACVISDGVVLLVDIGVANVTLTVLVLVWVPLTKTVTSAKTVMLRQRVMVVCENRDGSDSAVSFIMVRALLNAKTASMIRWEDV